jgi:transposase-like protein
MNFIDFQAKFPTENEVINHFIKVRYNETIYCPHCASVKVYHKNTEPKTFTCADCKNSFSIFKGTIFENSSTSLIKWMYAIHLFLNGKKGISGLQLKREINVTYKTAWRMLKQIRIAMGNNENNKHFEAIVEMDETYIGGKPRKSNTGNKDSDKELPNKRGRGTKKTPVVGIIERNSKKVHAKVALPNKEGKKLTGKQLLKILSDVTKDTATVITDEFKSYNILNSTKYIHLKIDHTQMFAKDGIHTNNVESFWATLKRGIFGIYHHVSNTYLQNYVNEFCFRHNNRLNNNSFDLILQKSILV